MTKIEPALTAEEWSRGHCRRGWVAMAAAEGQPYFSAGDINHEDSFDAGPEARHAIAALALYGQPFGFTREDVQNLRAGGEWYNSAGYNAEEFRRNLAYRIEALIPPEDVK